MSLIRSSCPFWIPPRTMRFSGFNSPGNSSIFYALSFKPGQRNFPLPGRTAVRLPGRIRRNTWRTWITRRQSPSCYRETFDCVVSQGWPRGPRCSLSKFSTVVVSSHLLLVDKVQIGYVKIYFSTDRNIHWERELNGRSLSLRSRLFDEGISGAVSRTGSERLRPRRGHS